MVFAMDAVSPATYGGIAADTSNTYSYLHSTCTIVGFSHLPEKLIYYVRIPAVCGGEDG